jgi:uncharacterized ferredoxin-like protein
MPIIESEESEQRGILAAADLIALAVRTSPKARGLDSLSLRIVTGDDRERIAKAMEDKAEFKGDIGAAFRRDANSVRKSTAIILIGVKGAIPKNLNCGACGSKTCSDFANIRRTQGADFIGPTCVFQAIDLGIALGSAVKLASELNVDNRIMYTVGSAAKMLNMLDADIIIGLPLSATGKNIYFDRR